MNRFFGRFTRDRQGAVADVPGRACSSVSVSTRQPRSRCFSSPLARPGAGLPFYAILCLPILFAAGMSLLDTIDGSFMNFAYGWAFSKPVRKVYYNITITALSVAVALVIGTVELLGLAASELDASRSLLELGLGDQHQYARLHHRRPVRAHLGRCARDLALRPRRRALDSDRGGGRLMLRTPERVVHQMFQLCTVLVPARTSQKIRSKSDSTLLHSPKLGLLVHSRK